MSGFARAFRRTHSNGHGIGSKPAGLYAEELITGYDMLLKSANIEGRFALSGVSPAQRKRAVSRLRALAQRCTEAAERIEDFDKEGVT